MRVLQLHNVQTGVGGSDAVIATERAALRRAGHEVAFFGVWTAEVIDGPLGELGAVPAAVWNRQAVNGVRDAVGWSEPHIAHVHTVFPVMSPAVLRALSELGVPTVVTHHSYRAACVNSMLRRADAPCTQCVGRTVKAPALRYGCYQNSRARTVPLVASAAIHRMRRSWDGVRHIALSEFGRDVLLREFGSDALVHTAPNFLLDEPERPTPSRGERILFVGRLHWSKGVREVISLAERSHYEITIVGGGPLEDEVRAASQRLTNLDYLGFVPREQVSAEIARHAAVLVPSAWHEACPMVVLEAYACGVPVIAPIDMQFSAMVERGVTGEVYDRTDPRSLETAVGLVLMGDYLKIPELYAARYSETAGVNRLLTVYSEAVTSVRDGV